MRAIVNSSRFVLPVRFQATESDNFAAKLIISMVFGPDRNRLEARMTIFVNIMPSMSVSFLLWLLVSRKSSHRQTYDASDLWLMARPG